MIRNFIRGIKNIIKWAPIIYRDRDWDYAYLLRIMKFKLSNMYTELRNSPYSKYTNTKAIRSLKIITNLLDRLEKDEYNDKSIYKIMDEEPNIWERPENYEKPKGHTKRLKRELDKGHVLRQRDKEYLNELFKKYLEKWWD